MMIPVFFFFCNFFFLQKSGNQVQGGQQIQILPQEERRTSGTSTLPSASCATPSTGLTCQELLALSGALGAALPTPLALPTQTLCYDDDVPTVKLNNNNPLNSSGPILPTLAMALWPEPYAGELKHDFIL